MHSLKVQDVVVILYSGQAGASWGLLRLSVKEEGVRPAGEERQGCPVPWRPRRGGAGEGQAQDRCRGQQGLAGISAKAQHDAEK